MATATRRSPQATLGATVAHPMRCRCLAILADRVQPLHDRGRGEPEAIVGAARDHGDARTDCGKPRARARRRAAMMRDLQHVAAERRTIVEQRSLGAARDATGSFTLALWLLVGLSALLVLACLPFSRRRLAARTEWARRA